MRTPSAVLKTYLDAIQYLSGAKSVSVFVPDPLDEGTRSVLLQVGDNAPIAEMGNLDAATKFATQAADSQSHRRDHAPLKDYDAFRAAWVPSVTSGGFLIPLADRHSRVPADPTAWLGLAEPANEAPGPDSTSTPHWWGWLLKLGDILTQDLIRVCGILNDPVSGLAGRAEFFQDLGTNLTAHQADDSPLSVAFISPDNFSPVNELQGLKAGDAVIREIADRLRTAIADDGSLIRYGGIVFAVMMPRTSQQQAHEHIASLLNTLQAADYLDDTIKLRFSAGIATAREDLGNYAPLKMIQRASYALNAAKRAGGGRAAAWEQNPNDTDATTDQGNELTGIFTGTIGKDYRNMVLLWDTVGLMAQDWSADEFGKQVLDGIFRAFRPSRVALFVTESPDNPLLFRCGRDSQNTHDTDGDFRLTSAGLALLERARNSREVVDSQVHGNPRADSPQSLVVPLITRETLVGCLYLDQESGNLKLDSADIQFLTIFGGHLAVAIDRGMLAERESQRQERNRLKLLGEVHELRQALGHSKLIHSSRQMEQVLQIIHQVAPTDATILVTGESGTGKGVLARTIHKLSKRSEAPLVVVDCSAITASLIESELFGHERGAFTGADKKSIGRLVEADRGTVFLDEIGELPLEVQSKLLTFVQEKRLTAVGSNKQKQVDVRIIAATNRNLEQEVEAGRFRQDLYYRLNVVTVDLPPLRDRANDILILIRHFVERYNVQYQKAIQGLTAEAEQAATQYHWPGNIRELQNRVMRAVILSQGAALDSLALGFGPTDLPPSRPMQSTSFSAAEAVGQNEPGPLDPWDALNTALGNLIQQIDINSGTQPLPFGKWLEEDLIQAAYEKVGGVHRRGATLLGIPETTFRRRMKQIQARAQIGPTPRTPEWLQFGETLTEICSNENPMNEDLLVKGRQQLLVHVLSRFGDQISMSAALMGVTEPTIHRWRAKLS